MNAYVWIPVPLWFMDHVRHHCKGGRTRSARFMDRRAYVVDSDLNSKKAAIRYSAWRFLGPFRKPIYPARVTEMDLRQLKKRAQICLACGASLADRQRGIQFCDQVCKRRHYREFVPVSKPRSLNMRGKKLKKPRKRALTNWCPVCKSYQPQNHPQPCKRGA